MAGEELDDRRVAAGFRGPSNINILLSLLEQTEHLDGDVAECGVFRAATLLATALHLHPPAVHNTFLVFYSSHPFDESVAIDVALGGRMIPRNGSAGSARRRTRTSRATSRGSTWRKRLRS